MGYEVIIFLFSELPDKVRTIHPYHSPSPSETTTHKPHVVSASQQSDDAREGPGADGTGGPPCQDDQQRGPGEEKGEDRGDELRLGDLCLCCQGTVYPYMAGNSLLVLFLNCQGTGTV